MKIFGSALQQLQELQISCSLPFVAEPQIITPEMQQIESKIAERSLLNILGVELILVTDENGLDSSVAHLQKSKGPFGIDIETSPFPESRQDAEAGLIPRKSAIRLIQIFDGEGKVFVFDLFRVSLKEVHLSLWDKPFIAHNALFELKHLLHKGVVPKRLGCTLLADRVIYGARTKLKKDLGLSGSAGLKDLAREHLSLDISKELQTSDWSQAELSPEQIEYAAIDAVLPVRIFFKQLEILKRNNLLKSYELLRDAQQATASMELEGIGFNVERHKSLILEWNEESVRLKEEIAKILGLELNLNSSKQLGEWLNEALKQEDLDLWIKTGKGALSTSTPTFKLKQNLHTIFPKIVEYRQVAKKISSFGEGLYKFIDIQTNRLYGSFSLGTTSTGRMASNKPNMQNMPRSGFRDLFVAKPGHVLIGLDYSQQELRVAALIANDKELLRIYEEGGDVHANTAASLLNISRDSVTKAQRQLAKAVAFGLLYGQGAKGLAIYAKQQYGVEMSEGEAEKHRDAFFKTYSNLRKWQKETGNIVKITGKVRTQCGRLRDFNRELEGYRFTAALNLPIQGSAAEITLRAMTRLTPMLNEKCSLVNVIHDEILLEVIESGAQEIAARAAQAMEAAFLDVFPNAQPYMKGLVEAKIGKNWSETK